MTKRTAKLLHPPLEIRSEIYRCILHSRKNPGQQPLFEPRIQHPAYSVLPLLLVCHQTNTELMDVFVRDYRPVQLETNYEHLAHDLEAAGVQRTAIGRY